MQEDNIITLLQDIVPHELVSFEYNGLLTRQIKRKIQKMGVTLSLSGKSIAYAIKRHIDFLLVHNVPDNLNEPYYQEIVQSAEKHKVSLYKAHLPLDFMRGGLIDLLCQQMQLQANPADLLYEKHKIVGGVYVADLEVRVQDLIKKVRFINPSTIRIVRGTRKIKRIAITTGDGCNPAFLLQLNPDVFICGLFNQEAIRLAQDLGITLIEATSYATENEPLKTFANQLSSIFESIEVEFIDIKNDVEAMKIT